MRYIRPFSLHASRVIPNRKIKFLISPPILGTSKGPGDKNAV